MALEQKLSLKLAQKLVMTPSLQQASRATTTTAMWMLRRMGTTSPHADGREAPSQLTEGQRGQLGRNPE